MRRRDFVKGGALLAAAVPFAGARAEERRPAPRVAKPGELIGSHPVLQSPSPVSVAVAFAVNALANGFVDVSESPDLSGATRHFCGGFGMRGFDDRVISVRVRGLRPATRYFYRVGAFPLDWKDAYHVSAGAPEFGAVHSFSTPGEKAESRFAVMQDTHAHANWVSNDLVAKKIAALHAPVTVWNGDASNYSDEQWVAEGVFLKPKVSVAYAADVPVSFLPGNHDFRGKWNRRLTEIMLGRDPMEREGRFAPLDWSFAYRQGEIAMIGLDTGEDKPDSRVEFAGVVNCEPAREMQAEWLKAQFARPEIASAPFAVVFCHIPLFDKDPRSNPGTMPVGSGSWQKRCAELWGPILVANRVQLVVAAHQHQYRFDPAAPGRPWAQIVGGGPEMGEIGWKTKRKDPTRFPTVFEGAVRGGKLVVSVHDVWHGTVVAEHVFLPR